MEKAWRADAETEEQEAAAASAEVVVGMRRGRGGRARVRREWCGSCLHRLNMFGSYCRRDVGIRRYSSSMRLPPLRRRGDE